MELSREFTDKLEEMCREEGYDFLYLVLGAEDTIGVVCPQSIDTYQLVEASIEVTNNLLEKAKTECYKKTLLN